MTNDQILQAVSDVTGVSKEDILSSNKMIGTRKKEIVFARYLSIVMCKTYQIGTWAEIMSFHNRDRSQYWHSVKTFQNDIEQDTLKWWKYFNTASVLGKIEAPPKPKREFPVITEDLSDDEYQDLTSEALKFQTNKANG